MKVERSQNKVQQQQQLTKSFCMKKTDNKPVPSPVESFHRHTYKTSLNPRNKHQSKLAGGRHWNRPASLANLVLKPHWRAGFSACPARLAFWRTLGSKHNKAGGTKAPSRGMFWMMGNFLLMVALLLTLVSIRPESQEDIVGLTITSSAGLVLMTALLVGQFPAGPLLSQAVGLRRRRCR